MGTLKNRETGRGSPWPGWWITGTRNRILLGRFQVFSSAVRLYRRNAGFA
jgi:hypothetical protein